MTEPRLRVIVATGQWSSSLVIVIALLAVMLHVLVPDWLTATAEYAFLATFPLFLVLGMILVVRLPDGRKIAGLVVNAFIILAGMGLMSYTVELDRASGQTQTLDRIHAGAEYTTTKTAYDAAVTGLGVLTARTFPAEFLTSFRENEAAKKTAKAEVDRLADELVRIEAGHPVASVTGSVAFDIFGHEWSSWVQGLMMLILAGGNEVIALVLMWGSAPKTAPIEAVTRAAPRQVVRTERTESDITPTVEQYVALGRERQAAGLQTGYRFMSAAMGISDRRARDLYREAIEKGLVRKPETSPKTD